MGQVIHDKFVVIDFNDANPIVFTRSSNLAAGGETSNGDNLIAVSDPVVASAFAVEAPRLVDHYHFRANIRRATDDEPLVLATATTTPPWYASRTIPATSGACSGSYSRLARPNERRCVGQPLPVHRQSHERDAQSAGFPPFRASSTTAP